jgi:hypothetical protein
MKKLLALLAFVILAVPVLYGQGTITLPGMTEATSVAANDILWLWLDPAGANASRKIKASNLLKQYHSCEVVFGDLQSADPINAGSDQPGACGNVSGHDATIAGVACYADAGSPTVTPTLTGGTAILTGALTCGNASWAAGTLSGTPTLKTFSTNGATCTTPPCDIAANLTDTTTAKYIVIRFTILW